MTHLQTYQQNALRTEKPLPSPFERLIHALLGLITETGEITTEIKRMEIYEKKLSDVDPKTNLTRAQHIAEEIGDVMWYLAIAGDAIGENIFDLPDNVPHDGYAGLEYSHIAFSLAETNGDLVKVLMNEDATTQGILELLLLSYSTLMALAYKIGISIDQIAGENIAKLRERFPDAYSNEAAEARADKGGLDARNS